MPKTNAGKGAVNWVMVVIFAFLFLFVVFFFAAQIWGPASEIPGWWKIKI